MNLTEIERRAQLEHAVAGHVRSGAVVLYQSSSEALLVFPGKHMNNVLHAILSIFTFGLWLFVWALVAIYCAANGDRQFTVSVDEHGTTYSDLRPKQNSAKTWMIIGGVLLVLIILASI